MTPSRSAKQTSLNFKFSFKKKRKVTTACASHKRNANEVISARSISHDRQDCILELFIELNPPETAGAIKRATICLIMSLQS